MSSSTRLTYAEIKSLAAETLDGLLDEEVIEATNWLDKYVMDPNTAPDVARQLVLLQAWMQVWSRNVWERIYGATKGN